MQPIINKFKQHSVLYVNILFTLFCILFNLSLGIQLAWLLMWLLVPILLPANKSFECIAYMSLYMRVLFNFKQFSIIICISIFIILIKQIFVLNKNKLLNKYFKMLIFYLILIIYALFYSIFVNKLINISFIYYLNALNLLFLFYLLKNKLEHKIILTYCYGLIISSVLSLICFGAGLHYFPFDAGNRFCAFMPLCNSLGVSCIVGISLLYVIMVNSKLNQTVATTLIGILSLIGILTLSKTFIVSFTIILLVMLINQFRTCNNRKSFLKKILLTTIILSPLILYYGVIMLERFFGDTSYSNIIDTITTGRLDKWLIYIKPWAKHFYSIIFGLGLGFNYNTPYSSHSLYVGYLSKIGIVGLIGILTFIYLIVFNKNKTNLKLKYLPIIIALIVCFAEDLSYNTFNFIPFAIALTTTMQNNDV